MPMQDAPCLTYREHAKLSHLCTRKGVGLSDWIVADYVQLWLYSDFTLSRLEATGCLEQNQRLFLDRPFSGDRP